MSSRFRHSYLLHVLFQNPLKNPIFVNSRVPVREFDSEDITTQSPFGILELEFDQDYEV